MNTTSAGNRRDYTIAKYLMHGRLHSASILFSLAVYAYGAIQFLVSYFPVLLVFRVPLQLIISDNFSQRSIHGVCAYSIC